MVNQTKESHVPQGRKASLSGKTETLLILSVFAMKKASVIIVPELY